MKQLIKRPLRHLSKHLKLWHEAAHHTALIDMAKQRVFVSGLFVILGYVLICGRLVDVMLLREGKNQQLAAVVHATSAPRANIVDRNGEILATDLVTASVYANPKVILNAKEAAEKLAKILPDMSVEALHQRLTSGKGFIWIARHVPPRLQYEINNLGIPGVYLQKDHRRVYPYGTLVSHVLGYCGVDRNGLSGVEKFFDVHLWQKNQESLKLSIDVRVQHLVHDELSKAIQEFNAKAGNAMVMDLETGELVAMVSLPDFDPNLPNQNNIEATFNRNTLGVYEPGSTFKILNAAIALETGTANLNSTYDARFPYQIGHFKVEDFRGKNRILTFKEAFIYSSNIASIRIALGIGSTRQREYLKNFGVFQPAKLEVPEIGRPLVPGRWQEVTTMTVAYGYGVSVSPLQTFTTVSGIVNNGVLPKPTLLSLSAEEIQKLKAQTPHRIVSEKTSAIIREFMRTAASDGTTRKADVPGYLVFGKTGTAYQSKGKAGYGAVKSRTTSFIGGFPTHQPRYMLMVMLDDPKPTKGTYGFAAAGWNAAPTAGRIFQRLVSVLAIKPVEPTFDQNSGLVNTSYKANN